VVGGWERPGSGRRGRGGDDSRPGGRLGRGGGGGGGLVRRLGAAGTDPVGGDHPDGDDGQDGDEERDLSATACELFSTVSGRLPLRAGHGLTPPGGRRESNGRATA